MGSEIIIGTYNQEGGIDAIRSNPASNALVEISNSHHNIHEGKHFYAYKSASLTNGQVLTLGLTTPDTAKRIHMFMEFDIAAASMIDMLEDVTSFSGGAAFTILNNDRESSNPSGATVIVGHTGSDLITPTGGTERYAQALGSGNRSGGTLGHDAEMILKRNSNYLFRITNGVTTQGAGIILQWYEHTSIR